MNKSAMKNMLNGLEGFVEMSRVGVKMGVSSSLLDCLLPIVFELIAHGTQKLTLDRPVDTIDGLKKISEVLETIRSHIAIKCDSLMESNDKSKDPNYM